jgi:dTDP-4-amino-4,6-dideoxygalactose transaminase
VSGEIASLPIYPELEEKEISYIIAKIINYFKK